MPLAKKIDKKYSYQDYISWNDDERWEIINGEAYNMTPAPSVKHQSISRNISWTIANQKNKLKNCSFFEAPTDVVFDEFNILQPDIFIVCEREKITEKNIQGAPELIIEIVSPATEIKDRKHKLKTYEKFGVREYIIIFPEREYLERYILKRGKYSAPEIFNWDEEFKFNVFNIKIKLWEIFEKKKENVSQEK